MVFVGKWSLFRGIRYSQVFIVFPNYFIRGTSIYDVTQFLTMGVIVTRFIIKALDSRHKILSPLPLKTVTSFKDDR